MNKPTQTYRIWHANRSGSTYLCQLLENLCYAGIPGEHYTLHGEASLSEKYKVSSYDELIDKIWEIGSTSNGVFADKATGHNHYHKQIIEEISQLKKVPIPESYEDLWQSIFPNCKHVLIIRTNKIRQAVSWWKAIQDNQWHLFGDQSNQQEMDFYDDKYNVNALRHLYNEAILRDIANQEYLVENKLNFITVTYEDLVANTLQELNRVLSHVNLPITNQLPSTNIKKTSNELNELWVNRFKKDLQEKMDMKVTN